MADRRITRRMTGPEPNRTTAARATSIAELLQHECSILLELYRKKEGFTSDLPVGDGRLVSVPPLSSQLDSRDKLWRVHSALLQCRSLMERSIIKEDEEFGTDIGEYESQRNMVKDRLSLLLANTAELKAIDGTVVLSPMLEVNATTNVFDLKIWIYRIFKELDHWTKTAITVLQALSSVTPKERARRVRSTRSTRR
ncbi:ciliary neurotrophic factor [Thalassophryne amazonica]|uniref:ciliary neurotrophic factor n=1 Tax=Thalassophryne amazonica TaxID=390379 RepID=UPI001470FDC9|nr:ciliary neurotrophic factor [Thalassophryne amazonica]